MSDKINVEKILGKDGWYWQTHDDDKPAVKRAIKEIVEAVIDKCAENAKLGETEHGLEAGWKFVDKKSILNIKKEIEYE